MKLPKLALCAVLFAAPAARADIASPQQKIYVPPQRKPAPPKPPQAQTQPQCGFAGCSSTTLVVFTYRTRGANTATSSVMALVSCPPIMRQGCTAVPAEVQPQGQLEQTR